MLVLVMEYIRGSDTNKKKTWYNLFSLDPAVLFSSFWVDISFIWGFDNKDKFGKINIFRRQLPLI